MKDFEQSIPFKKQPQNRSAVTPPRRSVRQLRQYQKVSPQSQLFRHEPGDLESSSQRPGVLRTAANLRG
jgi:hypothetical protein